MAGWLRPWLGGRGDGHFSAFLDVLERGEFVPGARIIANAGTPKRMFRIKRIF